jgi:hypothetical protein
VKATEAIQAKSYSDLEAKEMTIMRGIRRALPPFKAMKIRTEEELAACGGGGARGSNYCDIRIWRSVITKEATIILLSSPRRLVFSCRKRGGGLTQTRPECGRRMALFLLLLLLLLLLFFLFQLLNFCRASLGDENDHRGGACGGSSSGSAWGSAAVVAAIAMEEERTTTRWWWGGWWGRGWVVGGLVGEGVTMEGGSLGKWGVG